MATAYVDEPVNKRNAGVADFDLERQKRRGATLSFGREMRWRARESSLSAHARLVIHTLSDLLEDPKRPARPSWSWIQKSTGLSRDSIARALKEIRESAKEIVSVQAGERLRSPNVYRPGFSVSDMESAFSERERDRFRKAEARAGRPPKLSSDVVVAFSESGTTGRPEKESGLPVVLDSQNKSDRQTKDAKTSPTGRLNEEDTSSSLPNGREEEGAGGADKNLFGEDVSQKAVKPATIKSVVWAHAKAVLSEAGIKDPGQMVGKWLKELGGGDAAFGSFCQIINSFERENPANAKPWLCAAVKGGCGPARGSVEEIQYAPNGERLERR